MLCSVLKVKDVDVEFSIQVTSCNSFMILTV